MTTFDEAVKAIKQHGTQYQAALEAWPAYLGDGAGTVIGSQQRYYYCRYPSANSPAVEVLAGDCPPIDGLRVMIGYSADLPDTRKIVSWDDPKLDNSLTPIRQHATQHAYLSGDTVWVDWRQITQLKVQPYSGLLIYINGGVLPRDGIDTYINPVVVDLFDSVPTSSGQGLYALISLDSNGAVVITDGTPVTPSSALSIENVPDTPTGNFRLAAVRLVYGQTTVEEYGTRTDILDLRWPQESIAGSPYALFGTQTANTVLAGPTTGSAALPSFRALVDADLPVHDIVSAHDTSGRTAGQVLQAASATTLGWSTNTLSIAGNSTINGSLIGNISGGGTLATGGFTGTLPATGTFALLQVANSFTVGPQTVATGADANKGIIAKANSATQTANLIEVQNSSGTGLSAFSGAGNLRIGSATVRDSIGAEITKTYSSPSLDGTTFYYYGLRSVVSASPTSNTVSDWRVYGLDLTATAGNANNINGFVVGAQFAAQVGMTGGTLTNLYGGLFALNGINASGTATTTNAFAGRFQLVKSGAGTWSIGTASIISIGKPSVLAGTLSGTTLYGINIEDINGASSGAWTNRYAVNSAGGRWVIANSADEVLMTLTGFATQTATTTLVQATRNDANTNALGTIATWTHNSTGTAAAGFGARHLWQLESSTTASQDAAAWDVLWATATHASRKARISSSVYDTAARQWLQVDTDGASADVLINSLIYGSMYADDIAQLVTVSAAGTYYEVGGGLSGGNTNGMTFQNSKELLVTVAGKYLVTWSMSLSAGNNDHIEGAAMINSTVAASTENAAHTPGAGDQVGVSGSGILTLAVNDLLKLCVENETDTDDITVSHATLTAVRIGE